MHAANPSSLYTAASAAPVAALSFATAAAAPVSGAAEASLRGATLAAAVAACTPAAPFLVQADYFPVAAVRFRNVKSISLAHPASSRLPPLLQLQGLLALILLLLSVAGSLATTQRVQPQRLSLTRTPDSLHASAAAAASDAAAPGLPRGPLACRSASCPFLAAIPGAVLPIAAAIAAPTSRSSATAPRSVALFAAACPTRATAAPPAATLLPPVTGSFAVTAPFPPAAASAARPSIVTALDPLSSAHGAAAPWLPVFALGLAASAATLEAEDASAASLFRYPLAAAFSGPCTCQRPRHGSICCASFENLWSTGAGSSKSCSSSKVTTSSLENSDKEEDSSKTCDRHCSRRRSRRQPLASYDTPRLCRIQNLRAAGRGNTGETRKGSSNDYCNVGNGSNHYSRNRDASSLRSKSKSVCPFTAKQQRHLTAVAVDPADAAGTGGAAAGSPLARSPGNLVTPLVAAAASYSARRLLFFVAAGAAPRQSSPRNGLPKLCSISSRSAACSTQRRSRTSWGRLRCSAVLQGGSCPQILVQSCWEVVASSSSLRTCSHSRRWINTGNTRSCSSSSRDCRNNWDSRGVTCLFATTRTGVAVPPYVAAFGKAFVYTFLKPLRKTVQQQMQQLKNREAQGEQQQQQTQRPQRRLRQKQDGQQERQLPAGEEDEEDKEEEEDGQEQEERQQQGPGGGEAQEEQQQQRGRVRKSYFAEFDANYSEEEEAARLEELRRAYTAAAADESRWGEKEEEAAGDAPGRLAEEATTSHGGRKLRLPVGRPPRRAAAAPLSLMGDWLLLQAMDRQRQQSLSSLAFDSEAIDIKAAENCGAANVDDTCGEALPDTLAAAAAAQTDTNAGGLAYAPAAEEDVNARINMAILNRRRSSSSGNQDCSSTNGSASRNTCDGCTRGSSSSTGASRHTAGASLRFASDCRSAAAAAAAAGSEGDTAVGAAAAGQGDETAESEGAVWGEGFENYIQTLDETSQRGGGVAMELWLPGVRANDIRVELRLVGREEYFSSNPGSSCSNSSSDSCGNTAGSKSNSGVGSNGGSSDGEGEGPRWELDEEFVLKEKVESVEERRFSKEKKRWIPTLLPMLVVNAPKSRAVLRWEIETFRTRQRHNRVADYAFIQRAHRLVWPADVRAAEARLDSGRLMVVIPPLENLQHYDIYADAELFPLRVPVDKKPLPWSGLKGFRIYHSRRDWIFNFHKWQNHYPPGIDLFGLKKQDAVIRQADPKEEQEARRMAQRISSKNWRLWRGPKL